MAIIGAFPTNLQNGTIEDATQVMLIFDFIASQVNLNAVAQGGGGSIVGTNNIWTGTNKFNAGLSIDYVDFDSASFSSQNLLKMDAGLYSVYSSSIANIVYGFASDITRTSGNFHTVGGQFSAYAGANNSAGTFGVVTQAFNNPGFSSDIIGAEFAVVNRTSNLNAKVGMDVVFKDRMDGDTSVSGGLSTNLYNYGSKAIMISSQIRSSTGEFCGWKYGIKFDEFALDADTSGPAYGIDFSALHYYGGSNPLTAYRMSAAIRMRDLQSILWNADANSPIDPVSPIRTYLDPFDSNWKITNTNLLRFGVNVTSGNLTFGGTATAAALLDVTGCVTLGGLISLNSSNTMFSASGLGSYQGKIKVIINGTTRYIPIYL